MPIQHIYSCNPKYRVFDHLNYIRDKKSPSEQKALSRARELKAISDHHTKNFVSLDNPRRSFNYDTNEIIHVSSPNIAGDLRPKPASQSPSQVLPYIQSEELVSLLTTLATIFYKNE